jgi:murein L,D-transpeptidase YafK
MVGRVRAAPCDSMLRALFDQMAKVKSANFSFWPQWLAGHTTFEIEKDRELLKRSLNDECKSRIAQDKS